MPSQSRAGRCVAAQAPARGASRHYRSATKAQLLVNDSRMQVA
jgi:hypothetical protein